MTEIDIPPAALEAGKDTAFAWLRSHMEDDVRVQNMTDEELGELVEAACIAMLRSWPGMCVRTRITDNPETGEWNMPERMLSLPLLTEKQNAEA